MFPKPLFVFRLDFKYVIVFGFLLPNIPIFLYWFYQSFNSTDDQTQFFKPVFEERRTYTSCHNSCLPRRGRYQRSAYGHDFRDLLLKFVSVFMPRRSGSNIFHYFLQFYNTCIPMNTHKNPNRLCFTKIRYRHKMWIQSTNQLLVLGCRCGCN